MRFTSGTRRWCIAAWITAALACTAGWLILDQRLAEQTGLSRQVWLENDFQGSPVINDVARAATLDFLDDDPRLPREFISARWHGYWYVPSGRSFVLHVHADDHADVWINGELLFARSSAAARSLRLKAGVNELHILYQQYAGGAGLEFYERRGNAYPLPLRTGYLFPTPPEPGLLRLVTAVDRLRLTTGILWIVGALGAGGFIVRRRRAAIYRGAALPANAPTRFDAVVLTTLCLAILVYGVGNLWMFPATADGLHNLRLGTTLARDGTYRQWPWQVDEHEREPFGPSLIALADLASAALGFGAVAIECVRDETEARTRSEACRRQYVPYRATNLVLLVLGALGVFWLVLRLTGLRTLAYVGFLLTGQSAALLVIGDSFYTEIHAATLMVAVGGLAWLTASTRRLMPAALLGLALAALVLTKVAFLYLWIPIAGILAAGDLSRRRLDWTTCGLIGVMLVAHGIPVAAWMTRNYLVAGDFSIVEARSFNVLVRRAHLNEMRHDEWVAGFTYYLPPTGEHPSLETIPRESYERFNRNRSAGFRNAVWQFELRRVGDAPTSREEHEESRRARDEVAVDARGRLLADPVQHLKVSVLLAWRGLFAEEGLGFLSSPLTQRLADMHGIAAWPRWRRAYGATTRTVLNLAGFLALFAVPLWLWLRSGGFETVLIFLPAIYAHGAYSVVSHFLPRYALPQIPLRVVATMVLLFLVWSSLRRIVRSRAGRQLGAPDTHPGVMEA